MSNPNESVLRESQQKRKGNQKLFIIIASCVLFVGLAGAAWYKFKNADAQNTSVETYTVERKDLQSVVSSDGNIMNPNIVNLSFLVNGTIEVLNVEEGDKVEKGQVLAELDKRDFELDLKSAKSDVSISWANIQSKQAELTDTDLILSENDLATTKESLDSTQREIEQKVKQTYDVAFIEIETAVPDISTVLQDVDAMIGIEKNYTGGTKVVSVTNDSLRVNTIKNQYEAIQRQLDSYDDYAGGTSEEAVSRNLQRVIAMSQATKEMMENVVELLKSARATSSYSDSQISTARSTANSDLAQMNKQISSLTNTKQNLSDVLLSQRNNSVDAENKLKTAEIKLSNSQRNYEKSETTKAISLSVQYAQLEQAKLKVEEAEYNLELTTLTAPINGEVIQVNGSEGEAIKGDTTSSESAFIKILSDSNFTTEVYVEEVDIAQIELGQKVIITLDAIEDVELEGVVTFISSISSSDSNGIVTYLVRIDIPNTEDAPIREGMTTYVDFVLGSADNALVVPVQSVRRNKFVTMADGTRREVITGFSDGAYIEIKEGLEEGDVILKTGDTATGGTGQGAGMRELTEERIQSMKEAGFTDEEIKKMKNGEVTEEMRAKMQAMREANGDTGRPGMGGGFPPR